MATVNPVKVDFLAGKWDLYKWEALATGDTVNSLQIDDLAVELVFHAFGTFGGGTLTINGSNDQGTTFSGLTNGAGNVAALAAAGFVSVREQALKFKPEMTAGTADDVDVWLLIRYPGN